MPSALIVEDDSNDLLLLGHYLNKLGLKVTSAGTVEQAKALLVQRVGSDPFRIAFVDYNMQGSIGNGSDILRSCRQICPRLPVVMLTGTTNPDLIFSWLKEGFLHISRKPLATDQLEILLSQFGIPIKT